MTTSSLLPSLGFIFGGVPEGIFGTLVWLVISILATVKVIRETSGNATPLWLLFIWLIPCIGGIVALVAVRR